MYWMFWVNNYFPLMYGLLELEYLCERNPDKAYQLDAMKQEFKERYIEYCQEKLIFYIESEINYLVPIQMKKEYGALLLEKFKMYRDVKTVKDMLGMIDEIKTKYLA